MPLPDRRSLLFGVYATVALIAGTLLIVNGLGRIDGVVPKKPVYDLVVDWKGARAFVDGYSPYSAEGERRAGLTATGLGHPPTTLFWAIPLAPFSLTVAREVLLQLGLLLMLIELVLIAGALGSSPLVWPTAWFALGLILSCDWMDYLFFLGQISQLIAFAYFLAWYSLRKGWDIRAGLAVGAACTLKAYPGVLLLLLAVGRRWRALIAAATFYLVVAVIMTARFGLESWVQYASHLHGVANQWMASIQNQAVHGFVLRFFRPTCEPRGGTMLLATVISTTTAVVLLAGAGWLARRAARTRENMDIPFALAAVLSVFTSNWAWEHYNALFILPIAIVMASLPRVRGWGYGRGWAAGIAVLLMAALGALAVPILKKAGLQSAYAARPDPALHLKLHFFEALNMVPVISLIIALFLLLWLQERRPHPDLASAPAPAGDPPPVSSSEVVRE